MAINRYMKAALAALSYADIDIKRITGSSAKLKPWPKNRA